MKIEKFEVFKFELPLKESFLILNYDKSYREGFVVRITDDERNQSYGEISPLMGVHQETEEDILQKLSGLKKECEKKEFDLEKFDSQNLFADFSFLWMQSPVVSLGCEQALLHLLSLRRKVSISSLFSENPQHVVPLNGLLSVEKPLEESARLLAKGYRSIKMKVGRKPISEEIMFIKEFKQHVKNKITLRLDVNRGWDYQTAVDFCKGIGPEGIDYIEEPFRREEFEKLNNFHEETGFHIALDESLLEQNPEQLNAVKGLKAFVLKPSVLGLKRTLELSRFAKEQALLAIMSATFQSGLGLSFLAELAAATEQPEVAMGLSTFEWLKEDLLRNPFGAEQGVLDIKQISKSSQFIREEILKEVIL